MDKLKSRKFWIAVISAVLLVAKEGLGYNNIPSETIIAFAGIVMTYLGVQGWADGKTN